jgi:predicted RNA-binding protein with PUA-like domain
MLKKEENYPIRNRMKRLELVDKELFYISFNTRDN